MSAVDRFREAWDAKFPSVPPPDLPCLHVSQEEVRPENVAHGSVYGTVYSRLNPASVEQALQVCNATIAELHRQLERQQFVAEYLWEVLHEINTASVSDSPPPLIVPKQSNKTSLRIKDSASGVPLETDLSTAVSSNAGLDNIIPIEESPSSTNFSPLSLNSVFPENKTANPVAACNVTDLDKCQQSIRRNNSLPLLDREQNDLEVQSETERTYSLDSNVVIGASASENDVITPFHSFRHKDVTPTPPLQKAHRQKPVPTPRVTVNKQVASSVYVEDSAVGESSTDDVVSSGGNDAGLQYEPKHPAQSSTGAESASSVDDDQKIRSVKQRALAFTLSAASSTPPSVPGSAQKLAVSDSIASTDSGGSPRRMRGRRAERAHVYEEIIPVKEDAVDSDEHGAISSDDEEPLYYNLKMLQQSMLNRAKTFYSKGAQRPTVEQSKDVDTGSAPKSRLALMPKDDSHQLSGDSSK